MPTAQHGDVELFFEVFGSATDPTLLLINGLGSQCINYDERWCEKFAAQGYRVIRFDNRDTGLSSKLDGRAYALRDMAGDAVAVLDAANAERAHVMGVSMGGMIAQRIAIDHGDRLLSLTSAMSSTGEPEYGQSSPEARAAVMAKPAQTRDEYLDNQIAQRRIYGSKPEWIDEPYLRARAARAFDRCYCPAGITCVRLGTRPVQNRDPRFSRAIGLSHTSILSPVSRIRHERAPRRSTDGARTCRYVRTRGC